MVAPCVCTENKIAKILPNTFLGLPNLEWLDLNKNKLDARGLQPHAFKVCSSPTTCSPEGLTQFEMAPCIHSSSPHSAWRRPRGSTAQSTQHSSLG